MDNQLKRIFFTSDWHIGHKNILKFCERPFKDLSHMHEVLINNYNSTVPEDGVCYFLGDMGLCKSEVMQKVISRLNGTKILILGNHDGNVNKMYRMGFDAVMYGATLWIANEKVTLTHCPLIGLVRENIEGMRGAQKGEGWHGQFRHSRYALNNEGQFHLHGHIHSPNGGKSEKIKGRQYDVGVDANDYRPISISVIESWIAKTSHKS